MGSKDRARRETKKPKKSKKAATPPATTINLTQQRARPAAENPTPPSTDS